MAFVRRFRKTQYLLIAVLSTLMCMLYVELYSYNRNLSDWSNLKCANKLQKNECTKILLIADPQILGFRNEHLHFLTPITIFDSDTYLRKTYQYAYNFVQPDIVIFLGDLMDEGSIATNEEYQHYVSRFYKIFQIKEYTSSWYIWVPGDNDIGGEGFDLITAKKIHRFDSAFNQSDVFSWKNLRLFKINRLTHKVPNFKYKNATGPRHFNDSTNIYVGLSHLPILLMPFTEFTRNMLNDILPHVLFTGHDHKAATIITDDLQNEYNFRKIIRTQTKERIVYNYKLGEKNLYEFIVPTCSYRMGTDLIGFGFALIEKNRLQYTILWSPSRFHQLLIYLIFFMIFLVYGLCYLCKYFWRRPHVQYIYLH